MVDKTSEKRPAGAAGAQPEKTAAELWQKPEGRPDAPPAAPGADGEALPPVAAWLPQAAAAPQNPPAALAATAPEKAEPAAPVSPAEAPSSGTTQSFPESAPAGPAPAAGDAGLFPPADGPDLRVALSGWVLDNPVIPASGTFGFGREYLDFYDINILGSFCTKGTTLQPRSGNPTPRVAECRGGMLNSVGLQNPGIDTVVARELEEIKTYFKKPVIANVSGFSEEEFAACCEKLSGCDNVGIIEINISCPNVHGGGMAFGTSAQAAARVTRAARAATQKPIYIKLSPNVTDIVQVALACQEAGADGLALVNTLLGMRIDTARRGPVLANTMGGFSGPAIFPVALRMVCQVCRAVKIPVIGMGGVSTAGDVIEMMMAGAAAVQVGTANLVHPAACRDIILDLPGEMERLGITRLRDIIGCVN